ncbi:MAG: hypoxanthine phosphoribosyltransferase [Phycisphaerae bacterium]|nr:hypoxanthine phosphoribosyltransferase [Phycisphaerae bacterium]
MHRVDRVLIPKDQVAARVAELGRRITADLRAAAAQPARAADDETPAAPVVMVPILTGAMVFVADLIRAMDLKMSLRPITISSYPGAATTSQGATVRGELPTDLKGAHVILVDDILDSGRTLGLLRRVIAAQAPASLRIAVLLTKSKPGGRDEDVPVDYSGFTIDDEFVVGYGLDFDGFYRNLPDIVTLRPRS